MKYLTKLNKILLALFLLCNVSCFSQDTLFFENFTSATTLDDNTLASGNWTFGVDAPTGSAVNQSGNRWGISQGVISGNSLGVLARRQNGTWYTNYNGNNPAAITARSPKINAQLYQNITVTFKWKAVGETGSGGLPLYDYGMFGYSLNGIESGTTYLSTGGHPAFSDGYYETSSQNLYLNNGIVTYTATFNLNNTFREPNFIFILDG